MLWDEVKCFFDPELVGSLPDVRVPGTSLDDWQVVLDLVRASDWQFEYSVDDRVRSLPAAGALLALSTDGEFPTLRVWPVAEVLAIFRFYDAGSIDFDIDVRELQGQERLDLFCGFLTAIGRRLRKPVLMDAEGDHGHPLLGYDNAADRVVIMAEPLSEQTSPTSSRPADDGALPDVVPRVVLNLLTQ